jgi:gliding motility-associated-like protein
MLFRISLFFISILMSIGVHASHIVGGEIYYDYLGNNNYRVYIAVYRDCLSTGADFDIPLPLGVFNANNVLIQNVSVPYPGKQNLPVVFNNPCVVPPSGICVERAIYTTVLNLPPAVGGYSLVYQRCCRGPNITNIINPENTGFTLVGKIPGVANGHFVNSSPRFNNYPPLVLCNNEDLIFDHSATDPDGDELVYEMITPNSGATDFNPAPNPPPAPPYFPINWAGGFNAPQPLGPGSSLSINPQTGLLIADPELIGLFVVGVRVKEFRNGVQIGQTDRDFIFKVINCVITLQAIITPQNQMNTFVDYCQGSTITFQNQSYGGTSYAWDFGVPGITTDVSTSFQPTYTYPGPGTYEVTLVVNPGWPCTDTSVQIFTIYEQMQTSFTVNDNVCLNGNSLDFTSAYTGPPGPDYQWNFGINANPSTSNAQHVTGVTFSQAGTFNVTLTTTFENCIKTFNQNVIILPQPIANFQLPATLECGGLSVNFENTSQNATGYSWDFGFPGGESSQTNPSITFPNPGTYTVELLATSTGDCADSINLEITVNEALVVSFTSEDSLCITNNNFNFIGNFSGPEGSVIQWVFGPNASIQTANTLNVENVQFNTFGSFPITFSANFGNCSASYTESIFIFREPSIEFGLVPGLKCAPYLAQFIDSCVADSQIFYFWDFGDGNTSTEANPSNVYMNPGQYDVSLTIITPYGCIDTLELIKAPYIFVYPSPTAGFTVDPYETNICEAFIQFTDQSIDAYTYLYYLDENGRTSTESNPYVQYFTSGTKNPLQIITNEFGCTDKKYQTILIEPVSVFVPNTFTPDGNEFNNLFLAETVFPMDMWEMKIYNRWGELVFESNDPEIGWDGIYNYQMSPDGIYVYRIKYMSCEMTDEVFELKGHVQLLR